MSLGFSTERRRKKACTNQRFRTFSFKIDDLYIRDSLAHYVTFITLYARDLSGLDTFQWGLLRLMMLTQLSLVPDVDQNSAFGAVIHRGFESVGTE